MTHGRLRPGLAIAGAITLWGCASGDSSTAGSCEDCETLDPVQRTVSARTVPAPLGLAGSAYELAASVSLPPQEAREEGGLHNVFQLSDEIVSGSEPEGESSFRRLQEMGVRTILSVDGKIPDADLAARYGMGYVHVPIHYSGFDGDSLVQITKTFREKEGPFYVHCFHGKHRGPAAAAVGRLVLDGITRERALAEMRQWCGTADSYEGLYRAIANVEVPTAEQTESYAWDFPAAHALPGFRAVMIELPRVDDRLKSLSRHSFQVDPEHPDVDPVREAEQMAELFAASRELDEVQQRPEDFRGYLDDSVRSAAALRDALREWVASDSAEALARAQDHYEDVRSLCSSCHKTYRNR